MRIAALPCLILLVLAGCSQNEELERTITLPGPVADKELFLQEFHKHLDERMPDVARGRFPELAPEERVPHVLDSGIEYLTVGYTKLNVGVPVERTDYVASIILGGPRRTFDAGVAEEMATGLVGVAEEFIGDHFGRDADPGTD